MTILQRIKNMLTSGASDTEFGLLRFDYTTFSPGYTPPDCNLGDYIQSLAAKQYLPENAELTLIDRDTLRYYSGRPVKMIMNSYYFLSEKSEVFSDKIDPVMVSIHIKNTEYISNPPRKSTIEYLKQHEPIGCRDHNTELTLSQLGVKSYFSGCLTTTLDMKYKAEESDRTDEIIFCDYKFGDFPQADKYLKSLKAYDFGNIIYTTHSVSKELTHQERFQAAEELLRRYAKAKLVVTRRIHCALPCLALGTPVILVNRKYDFKRFNGLYSLLNTVGENAEEKFEIRVNLNKDGTVFNSKDYLKYARKLKSTVKKKVKKP